MELGNIDTRSRMEEYEGIERIGRGSLGAAFLVLHKNENKKYVLKKIRLSKMTEDFKCTVNQELNLAAKLHHPHILEYKDAWVEKGNCICIVTDYCEGGNIFEKMRKARGAYFPEEKLCKWLTQMLLAVDYLHTNRVLHRNIKLSNILVSKENDILLGDYGLGKVLDEEGLTSTAVGTLNYMCPELLENTQYCYKTDIWSLGCCIFEIAAHQPAFKAPDMAGLINKINRSLLSPFPYMYSSTLKQIIKSMLRKSPEHRPTAAELLRHPHLKPFLLRCRNLPTVFLPVKSPSPNSTKEKASSTSPSNSDGVKDCRESDMKPKQKELLPLFEENMDVEFLNLLDGDVLIEDKHETKQVDPTSFSANLPHDSASYKTTASNGDSREIHDSSLQKALHVTRLKENNNMLWPCVPSDTEERDAKEEDSVLAKSNEMLKPGSFPVSQKEISGACSGFTALHLMIKDKMKDLSDTEGRDTEEEDAILGNCNETLKPGSFPVSEKEVTALDLIKNMAKVKEDESRDLVDYLSRDGSSSNETKNEGMNKGSSRANVLESLLELCARLLKQDKLDELTGVLKAFGDETVSSRETAIWLTKSLINAQNLAKES